MNNNIKASLIVLALLTGTSCGSREPQQHNSPVIGVRDIRDEMAGSSYRMRAKGYYVVRDQDTSRFSCIFSEAKADSGVMVSIDFQKDRTYDEQLNEMKLIFPAAAKDFDLKRLKGFSLGRLVASGDLAVRITRQYRERFGNNTTIGSYSKVALFLKQSPLGDDLNALLRPYGQSVDHISVEKVFFTGKEILYGYSKLATDSAAIPAQILDCMIWVSLEP